MIKQHEFNSEWWGEAVGIVTDPVFFTHSAAEQRAALRQFAWAEFVHPVSKLPGRQTLAESGFFYTDTQVRFRIDLSHIKPGPCANSLQVEIAAESPFTVRDGDLKTFPHERFFSIPGATESQVNARYVRWSNNLIRQNPATCLRFLQDSQVQGWFLSHAESGSIDLTLAMLSATSAASGFDVYSRALAEYARMGFRLGSASFSVRNGPVLNIYAALGARFLEPRECWMWIRR
jgi:hypothetical protein